VYGFADPRPIIGTYTEAAATFEDSTGQQVTVSRGEALDNFKLAGLRARYTVDYLDKLFRGAKRGGKEYQELVAKGLVRWHAVSGNVDSLGDAEDLGTKRRIRMNFRIVRDS
jgi:hypothetical protein